jgi:hypothetical protein
MQEEDGKRPLAIRRERWNDHWQPIGDYANTHNGEIAYHNLTGKIVGAHEWGVAPAEHGGTNVKIRHAEGRSCCRILETQRKIAMYKKAYGKIDIVDGCNLTATVIDIVLTIIVVIKQ